MTLDIPRDRAGTFNPQLIAKYQRRFPDFDEKIISMYARGMTVREIRGHLQELYGIEVSPDLISTVTDAVLEAVSEWQNRPLDACYAIVFFDAIRVKIRDEGFVRNKAVYIALAILPDGTKEILGLWIEQTEGAKFWLRVMNELKNRGVQDILLAVVDGLKGFPEAINATFPETVVQTCIVHLIHHSMNFASWKDRKQLTEPAEWGIAWVFMQYGEWQEHDPEPILDGNRLLAVDFRWEPREPTGQGFEIVGTLSRMFARYYAQHTVDGDAVVQLRAPFRPDWFAPLVDMKIRRGALPLWRFELQPNFDIP